ncbi:MAG: D-glycero-beta-D-manno-heptose-7-phosphate kinase [Betaproteobacteria bacterium]
MPTSARRFADFRDAVRRAHVLVVGDAMLDRYWFGDVDRISPEAPVPVVKIARSEERPGGAANVARNAAALGAQVTLISIIGDDEPGRVLERLLRGESVNTSLHRDAALPTTVKLRVIGRQQQLLRIDFETAPSPGALAAKLADYERALAGFDVVVLSDYGKGGLSQIERMIALARAASKPVLVDPKGEAYLRYRGATMLTPNRAEFRQVVGPWRNEAELAEKAQTLRAELALEALLITRAEEGMSLYTDAGAQHIPAQAREVFDVSGAGDTVIATLGTLLGAHVDIGSAVRIANKAAGIVVGKLGTAVVHADELG